MTDELTDREFHLDVRADLDLVWDALTTPRGLASWYVVEAEFDAEIGGSLKTDWGTGMMELGVVEAIEPPTRLRMIYPEAGDWTGTEEWLLSHEDGVTHVRLIHSLPVGDGATWDGTYGDIVRGWTLFLGTLRFVLERHGRLGRDSHVQLGKISDGVWPRVLGSIGLAANPAVGDSVQLQGVPPAEVLESFDGYSLLLAFGNDATLMIDVEAESLYTLAAMYTEAAPKLKQSLIEIAARACEAAGAS